MKAVWYERTGPAPEVLVYGEMPTPVAGQGEVRIKLEASGVNPSDTYRRAGSADPMEYPRVIANSDNPSQVLAGLHRGVQSLLGQDEERGETDDGLEAG